MKEYRIDQLRNVSVVGHGGSGKTSLTEALLFTAGAIKRMGAVAAGTTTSDYRDEEIAHKISISATPLYCEWHDHKLNLIDTPGYTDFTGEVKCALRVSDGAVIFVRPIEGVEVETDRAWEYADEYGLPRMLVVNLLDKEHTDFYDALARVQERFGTSALPFFLPIGTSDSFTGVVDLVTMKAHVYTRNGPGTYQEQDIPADLHDQAAEHRERLMEAAAEADETLLEQYFDQGTLTSEQFVQGLKKGVQTKQVFPVLCSAGLLNVGTASLLDTIVRYFPSPLDQPAATGTRPGSAEEMTRQTDPAEPLAAFVFKTISEPHIGELSYFRVYAGAVRTGMDVHNVNRDATERIGQIYATLGKERHEVGLVTAGDIGAVVKLKNTHTGDTLSDRRAPILLPGITFVSPVVRMAIEPKSKEDEEKISTGLSRLHEEDPTFTIGYDGEIKQMILAGAGEMHLDVIVERLKRRFGVEVMMTKPRVPYRETIRGRAEAQGKYKRQTGGRGQYGDAWLRIEPLPRGMGFEFVDGVVGGVVPNKFIPAVEKGIREALEEGVLAGYPVVDVRATLYDGSYHTVDSSEMAFKIAASMGFKKAVLEAKPVLLEPIMEVEAVVPDEFMGDVMGDLSSRRGRILGMTPKGKLQVIRAEVPLAELYSYSTILRSFTQGRGSHTRRFVRYEEMPREVEEKVIADAKAAQAAE
ncbi:MAG: elongation factor G [Candidatus Latescibacteria bacterium]|nr:elongation factor G [Candidatus Latescibacterota bacterium]